MKSVQYFGKVSLYDKNLESLLINFPNLSVIKVRVTEDNRPDRAEKWLNAVLKKVK